MTHQTPRETLAARYERMAAEDGLVDVKFCLRNSAEATSDQVCGEINAMYDALDRGEFKPLRFRSSAS